MPSKRRATRAVSSATVTVILAALLGLGPAAAQESGSWSQYQGDAAHTGVAEDGPAPPFRVRWTLPAPSGESLSAAVVEGDEAITVGDEAVYGVDVANGEVAWEIPRAGGPLSVPAVGEAAGRRVLVYVEGPTGSPSTSVTPTPSESPSGTTSQTGSPSTTPSPASDEE